jgi:hypothetical protein
MKTKLTASTWGVVVELLDISGDDDDGGSRLRLNPVNGTPESRRRYETISHRVP